jgi:hypothetical protein
MAENPLKDMLPKDPQGPGMGAELGEKLRMQNEAAGSLHPASPVSGPAPVRKMASWEHVSGRKPPAGEKPIDTREMLKPLGSFHAGGTVPKTGPYVMKEGEKVLTPEQHSHLKSAMSLAQSALSHEEPAAPPEPKKVDKEMTVRRLNDKSFHIRHKHEPPHDMPAHDEEYSAPDLKGLTKHMEDHFGKEPESSKEEAQESPGTEAMEKAVGFEK